MRVQSISDWVPGGRDAGPAAVVGSLSDAQQWLGKRGLGSASAAAPSTARALKDAGARAVCIVGEIGADGRSLAWLESEHARGWLAAHREMICESADVGRFATQMAAAIRKGFVAADAAVLAMMACTRRPGSNANDERGADFVHDAYRLPQLSWGEQPRFIDAGAPMPPRRLDLYGIVESADRLEHVLAAGMRTVQLRIKSPPAPDDAWRAMLRREIERSILASRAASAELFVNDHWQLAQQLGAPGVHLGQEDLLALGDAGRSELLSTGLALGVSSHSLWELCRARALAPRYIACGPVWPTLTKAMPWIAQGLVNLAWWCRLAQVPVVAIGGVLEPEQVYDAVRAGADGVCIVRGLGDEPQHVMPQLQEALEAGRQVFALNPPELSWPHPSLQTQETQSAQQNPI